MGELLTRWQMARFGAFQKVKGSQLSNQVFPRSRVKLPNAVVAMEWRVVGVTFGVVFLAAHGRVGQARSVMEMLRVPTVGTFSNGWVPRGDVATEQLSSPIEFLN